MSRPALSEKGVDQEGVCVGWQDARFDQDQVGAGSVSKKMTSWGSGEPLNPYPGCLGHFTPFLLGLSATWSGEYLCAAADLGSIFVPPS